MLVKGLFVVHYTMVVIWARILKDFTNLCRLHG